MSPNYGTFMQPIDVIREGGETIAAEIAVSPRGTGPEIVVLCDDRGLTRGIRQFCAGLAEDGYVVVAPRSPGSEAGAASDVAACLSAMRPHRVGEARAAVVGFGTGAARAIAAAGSLPLAVAVSYYGTGIERSIAKATNTATALVLHVAGTGAPEDRATAEQLRQSFEDRPETQIFVYDACGPGFAETDNAGYDRMAARVAYSRTLTPLRRALGPHFDLAALLQQHLECEFVAHDPDATMATMVEEPYVNHIPTMTGGTGHDTLKRFYKYHFIPQLPEGRDSVLVSETVGSDTVVLEFISRFTHDREISYLLPGIPPTGRDVELAVVLIAKFRGAKLYNEHIYWDHASLLAQVGLIDPAGLPIAGLQGARKLADETLPSNELMPSWPESEGKPL